MEFLDRWAFLSDFWSDLSTFLCLRVFFIILFVGLLLVACHLLLILGNFVVDDPNAVVYVIKLCLLFYTLLYAILLVVMPVSDTPRLWFMHFGLEFAFSLVSLIPFTKPPMGIFRYRFILKGYSHPFLLELVNHFLLTVDVSIVVFALKTV